MPSDLGSVAGGVLEAQLLSSIVEQQNGEVVVGDHAGQVGRQAIEGFVEVGRSLELL